MKVLLGISGGIAAYKTPDLIRRLKKAGHEVRVACTRNALELVSQVALETVSGGPVLCETFTPRRHPGIEHIDLAGWADVVVIAPATANVIAKMAHGLADDLLTTVLLATPAPVWIAPGMNTRMWEHPATRENVRCLVDRGVRLIGPDSGELACGTSGPGRMSEPGEIVAALGSGPAGGPRPLAGRTVLVTAGATREHLDPVRFLSNPSTGRMGVAMARAAQALGARVILVHAHLEVPVPVGVEAKPVGSATELHRAVFEWKDHADLVIMTAAVGDYMPANPAARKLKKEEIGATLTIRLVQTPDILRELAQWRSHSGRERTSGSSGPVLLGFAAETAGGDEARLLELARPKLSRKGCDALFANDVSQAGAGFASDTNRGILLFSDGRTTPIAPGTKDQVAVSMLESVVSTLWP